MINHEWRPISVAGMAKLSLVLLLLASVAGPAFAGTIKLDENQIPAARGALKRLKNSRANAATTFAQKVLANSYPNAKFEGLSGSEFGRSHNIKASKDIQAAVVNDHVVATIDTGKGHTDVLADLANLTPLASAADPKSHPKPSAADVDQGKKAAEGVLRQGVFPADSTRPVLADMLTLETSQFKAGEKGGPPTFNPAKSGALLMTFPVKRMVGDLPVVGGKGSRGHIDVGKGGKVHGFSKKWQNATDFDAVSDTRSKGQIAELIRQQLADIAAKGDVEVQDVVLGYFDNDEGYMQPVYQYRAKVSYPAQGGAGPLSDDDYIAGYIPYGDKPPLEAIPSVNEKGAPPAIPQGAPTNLPVSELMPVDPPAPALMASAAPKELPPGDPTVGRYVVRNDYGGWVNSANGFWNGLMSTGYAGWFTNSQYYWAYPFETAGSKNSYVNAVNVAELEVHGDWWVWTTYQNWGDWGSVDAIPSPGLGSSAGGVCAYFIIHSCEVVPAAADTPDWHNKWWHVFGGLHSVLGYRTIMYIDDGAMYPFGVHMGWGYALVNSWLSDVASSPLYWFSPGQVMHGVWKPYGRPSTISVCGHEGDSVFYTAGVGPAGCLQNYWYW